MASADELRRRREDESAFAFLYDMARERDAQLAAEGRRPFLGGLLSVGNFGAGADKMDVLRDIDFEGVGSGLLGLLSPVARAIDAPISAYRGTIPQEDMLNEAMNVTGMAMAGGGAIASPQGALASNALRSDFVEPGKQFMRPMPDPDNDRFAPSDIVMAQRILDMRAAGRASEVTDEMMAQADPQYMFANTPLPMDEAARAARAEAAGFTTGRDRQDVMRELRGLDNPQLVHYTSQDFDEFRIPERENRKAIWATPDPSVNLATKDNLQDFSDEGAVGIPVMGRMTKRVSPYEFRMAGGPMTAGFPRNVTLEDVAKANSVGADYADAGLEYAIFNPANIRSRFARFDPEFAHLANLNAANASTVGGLLAQSGVSDKQAEKIETYLKKVGLLQ
jgi:hypothetical protein